MTTDILALDCATTTGYAHNCGGPVQSGFRKFDVKRGESPGMRFLRFREWLTAEVTRLQPTLIVFERPERFKSGAAAEVCLGLVTRVQEIAAAQGIDHTPVGPSTLKKWATGNGNAQKPEMIAAAVRHFRRPVTDDNEADALLILAWALAGRPDPAVQAAAERQGKDAARQAEIAGRTVCATPLWWTQTLEHLRGAEYGGARKAIRDVVNVANDGAELAVTFTVGQWAKLPMEVRLYAAGGRDA